MAKLNLSKGTLLMFLVIVVVLSFMTCLGIGYEAYKRAARSEQSHATSFLTGKPFSRLRSIEVHRLNKQTVLDDTNSIELLNNVKYRKSAATEPTDFHSFGSSPAYLIFEDGTRAFVTFGSVGDHTHVLFAYPYDEIEYASYYHAHLNTPIPEPLKEFLGKF